MNRVYISHSWSHDLFQKETSTDLIKILVQTLANKIMRLESLCVTWAKASPSRRDGQLWVRKKRKQKGARTGLETETDTRESSVTRSMKLVVFAVIASAFISLGKLYLIDGPYTDMIRFWQCYCMIGFTSRIWRSLVIFNSVKLREVRISIFRLCCVRAPFAQLCRYFIWEKQKLEYIWNYKK